MIKQSNNSIVRDIFKAKAFPRKKVSAIFTPKDSSISVTASQRIPLDGSRPKFYTPAIDIGSTSIKLLQLAKTSRGYEIAKIGFAPLEKNIKTLYELKLPLQNLIKENKLRGEVVSVLPLSQVQIYNFFLPEMPEAEIEQAVIWKLKQNPPNGMPFDTFSFDFVYYGQSEGALTNEIRVVVFVISKAALMERISLFKELSLELVAVVPEPYAIFYSLMWLGKIPAKETVIVLQLGAKESSISIVHAGQLSFMRNFSNTGNTLTEAITNFHHCDWLKAEAIKKQEGLKNWKPGAPQEEDTSVGTAALSSHLESLVLEVEQTFRVFTQQMKKKQLTSFNRLILCGGTASLINLDKFLSERLEVPVEVFNPLNSLKYFSKQALHPLIVENANRFAGVLGSAARNVEW